MKDAEDKSACEDLTHAFAEYSMLTRSRQYGINTTAIPTVSRSLQVSHYFGYRARLSIRSRRKQSNR
jgi:hypothetical protein